MARLDFRTFALLLPHTPIENAKVLTDRFQALSEKDRFNMNGLRLTFKSALTELAETTDEQGSDLLKRAVETLGEQLIQRPISR